MQSRPPLHLCLLWSVAIYLIGWLVTLPQLLTVYLDGSTVHAVLGVLAASAYGLRYLGPLMESRGFTMSIGERLLIVFLPVVLAPLLGEVGIPTIVVTMGTWVGVPLAFHVRARDSEGRPIPRSSNRAFAIATAKGGLQVGGLFLAFVGASGSLAASIDSHYPLLAMSLLVYVLGVLLAWAAGRGSASVADAPQGSDMPLARQRGGSRATRPGLRTRVVMNGVPWSRRDSAIGEAVVEQTSRRTGWSNRPPLLEPESERNRSWLAVGTVPIVVFAIIIAMNELPAA